MTFAQKVINFNKSLSLKKKLPRGIKVMNPFQDNPQVSKANDIFYNQFYDDNNQRKLILGINPGRLGAGETGVPFTDTKHFSKICKMDFKGIKTHEPSSVFVYEMIEAFGGAIKFYNEYYINSICPLGFIEKNQKGNWVNRNYYDYKELYKAVKPFMIKSLKQQIDFGMDTNTCFILGKKNLKFIKEINDSEKIFRNLLALDHPRYIEQYKSKKKSQYINFYLKAFKK